MTPKLRSLKKGVLAGLVAAVFIPAVSLSANTVAHYRFEEGSAGAAATGAVDSSGNGYNLGVLVAGENSPVYSSDVPESPLPRTGQANTLSADVSTGNVAFQGVDGEGLSNVVFDDFTIELYVKFNAVGGWQTIIGRDDRNNQTNDNHAIFYLQRRDDSGNFGVSWVDRNGAVVAPGLQGVNVQPNTWYHVAVVADLAGETIALYIDGIEVDRNNNFAGLFTPTGVNPHWNIGRGQWAGNPGDWVNGLIDEVRFSSVALSPSDFLNFAGDRIEIVQEPSDVIAWAGQNVSFSVNALLIGDGELSYQWQVSSDDGNTFEPVAGGTAATLTLNSVSAALDRNLYRVEVSSSEISEFAGPALLRVGDATPPSQPAGVVAYYRFEEGANGAVATGAQDSSGNNHHMTSVNGSPTFTSDGAVSPLPQTRATNNLAMDFRGGNFAVQGTDGDSLSQVVFDDFTIEVFVNFAAVGGWQTMVGRDDRGRQWDNNQSLLYFSNSGGGTSQPDGTPSPANTFRIEVFTNQNQMIAANSGFVIQPNTWYHVAAIGDSQAGTLSLYVDGALVSQQTGFTGLFQPNPATRWSIGRGQWGGNDAVGAADTDYVNGRIDEVRFSNVALAPTELLGFHTAVINYAVQPQDVTAAVGDDVTFTALAGGGGTGPLTYQWQVLPNGASNWENVSGATDASLTLTSVQMADHLSQYRVVASRDGNSEPSNAALLSVPDYPPPNVVQGINPAPLLFAGDPLVYSVEVTGLGNITYQWQRDGVDIEGATSNSLDLGVLSIEDSGIYSVIITDDAAAGEGLDPTTVTLTSRLMVLTHSKGAISLNFVGAATDTTWNVDIGPLNPNHVAGVVPVANWNNSSTVHGVANQTTPFPLVNDVGDSTTATATWASGNTWASRVNAGGVLAAKDPNQRIFHGYIEGRGGSSVTVQNIPYATYDVYVYPMGVEGPVDGGFVRSVTLQGGNGDQQLFGRNLSGNPTLAEIPFVLAHAASIEEAQASAAPTVFRFSNVSGSSFTVDHQDEIDWNLGGIAGISIVNTTPAAPVRPLLTSRPSGRFVPAGTDVQLSVTARAMNNGSLSYQWQRNGANIGGATGASLTLSNVTSADTGNYTVIVTEGSINNKATVPVVVVDDNRRALLSVDVNVGTHPWMQGHGRLRTTGLVPFVYPANETDNPMEIGRGDTIWNRFWGRSGTFTYGDFVDSEGRPLQGVTFTVAGANGAGNVASGGGLESLAETAPEFYSAPLLRDYVFANDANTMTLTLGGLQAFAGRDLDLVVYALGPLSNFDFAHDADDIATVTLAEVNNHLVLAPVVTETADEGRELRWNDEAIASFQARVAANGTVSWTVGQVPDRPGINAMNGFQVLFSDQGEPIDPPESGIADWRQENFGSPENSGPGANDAEFTGDGFKNLVKYALGADPTVAGSAHGLIDVGQQGDFLTLTFSHIDDPNLVFFILATNNLNDGFQVVHTFPPFNSVGEATYTDTVPISSGAQRFIRLGVSINE